VHSVAVSRQPTPLPSRQRGTRWAWLGVALIVVVMVALYFGKGQAFATANAIHSGFSGSCLDILHSGTVSDTPVDAAKCNGTSAQNWTTSATAIRHVGSNFCLATNSRDSVVLNVCSDAPGQVWLQDSGGYYNPDTGSCLEAPKLGAQLRLADCGSLSTAGMQWSPASAARAPACSGSEGEAVACNAVKQWTAWQASGSNHEALLTMYTDGTPYEEWCADFVSYVYKQAGHPFTNNTVDGWDENNANTIQDMGFTMHPVGSGYQPKPGDVAFFNYPGGHVEIVVSGGKKPTFVYGNSAQIDPATGNGQMKANTITQDDGGTSGQLTYYLSPNN
jgi:hypothetical protein